MGVIDLLAPIKSTRVNHNNALTMKLHMFNTAVQYYRHSIQTDAFHLTYSTKIDIEVNLKS